MPPDQDLTRTSPPAADADATRSPGDLPTDTGYAAAALRELMTVTGETAGAVVGSPTSHVVDAPPGFVVERELGVGGMGVVYLARQTGLNRPVALKVVKGGTAVEAKALIRFLAEAEAVAAVRHTNVVEVYQYGEHAGKPYMAFEFCPGGDLTALTKAEQTRDAAWFRRVADMMAGVADGVNAAHAQGIVHRDLKPHNVFLAADGTPKVADFGLAKRGIGTDLTNTEAVMGTPAYMAPEQAGGGTKFVGPEADVWALGVMLYELCCGERPIDTSGPVMVAIARVVHGDVSQLRTRVPAVPPDLALIAHKCLSRDPRDRYPTAGGLANDLRNWLDGKPIAARPTGVVEQAVKWAKRNPGMAAWAGGTVAALAVGVALSVWWAVRAEAAEADATAQLHRTREAERAATAALADSTRLAEELKVSLAEARRRTALFFLAHAQLCATASRAATASDRPSAGGAIAEYARLAPWVADTAEPGVASSIAEFDAALRRWSAGPPPAELRQKSLALARACREYWLTGVVREHPDVATDIRRRLYRRVTATADQLLSTDPPTATAARQQVWEAYWGELAIVESPAVEGVMVRLGRALQHWEANGRPPADLSAAVAALHAACDAE